MTQMQKPPAFKKGDTIGIVAISRWIKPEELEKAKSAWESLGYKVKIHPNNFSHHHEWGGDYQERAKALTEYWNDPEINAIISARGGLRTLPLLDHIDFNELKTPKIIMGASDITTLLNALYTQNNIPSFHGPVATRYAGEATQKHLEETISAFDGTQTIFQFNETKTLKEKISTGILVGGNMCNFNYLLGTKYCPDLKEKILFLEDDGEEIRNIDRMFLHLKHLGKLDDISGLIIGGFQDVKNTGSISFPYSLKDLILEYTDGLDIPVIMNAPFGHGKDLLPLPIGINAKLSTTKTTATLELLEPAVKNA
ncbi:MAG: S66 peptidase family protein [Bdellovibrionales bacterium]